ncbi:hypothetical protein Taro_039784 [Colocasia esculenta]|uniref:Uncharacterized protein n=1 Tax=Colocasia esculenta TaxID=4460 RepID=A0A843WR58_COLES|nr:hypothetical protein [Colocasia esculenta]
MLDLYLLRRTGVTGVPTLEEDIERSDSEHEEKEDSGLTEIATGDPVAMGCYRDARTGRVYAVASPSSAASSTMRENDGWDLLPALRPARGQDPLVDLSLWCLPKKQK